MAEKGWSAEMRVRLQMIEKDAEGYLEKARRGTLAKEIRKAQPEQTVRRRSASA